MTSAIRHPVPRLTRVGLSLIAATGMLVLSAFLAALAIVASLIVFGTNVFARADGLIALATALPLAFFGFALTHKRLWRGAPRPL